MIGHIDFQGRALVTIPVRISLNGARTPVEVWVDTGFTGDIVSPSSQIRELGLQASSVVQTAMADGRETSLDCFVAWLDWFGKLQVYWLPVKRSVVDLAIESRLSFVESMSFVRFSTSKFASTIGHDVRR